MDYKFGDYVKHLTYYSIIASDKNENNEYYVYSLTHKLYVLVHKSNIVKLATEKEIKRFYSTKVKIINYEESANVFNYRKIKSKLVGKELEYNYEPGYKCKIDNVSRDIIITYLDDKTKKLKFVESDCEYLYDIPKIQLKKHPTSTIIKIGSLVRVIKSKKCLIPKNSICEVLNIENSLFKYRDRAGKLFNNTKIATVLYNNKKYYVLVKNLKKINRENDTNSKSTMPF